MGWAKAWLTRLLKWRAQREAGFTEQRQPPALVSGWIAGRFSFGPLISGWVPLNRTNTFYILHNLDFSLHFTFSSFVRDSSLCLFTQSSHMCLLIVLEKEYKANKLKLKLKCLLFVCFYKSLDGDDRSTSEDNFHSHTSFFQRYPKESD